MAGVFGAVSTSPDDDSTKIVDWLSRSAKHGPWVTSRRMDARSCSLLAHNVDERHSIIENTECILAFQGEIFGTTNVASPYLTPGKGSLAVEALVSLYLNQGVQALCGLNGNYVIAVFDKAKESLSLISDRGGFSHLYYWHKAGTLLFSSELPSLLSHPKVPRDINLQTVGDILSVGYPLSDRTLFTSVSLLPAGTVLTFEHGSLLLRKYWEYEFGSGGGATDVRDLSEQAWNAIGQAVSVRTASRICVPITGGLDSRTVAGALEQFSPETIVLTDTIGPPGCIDVQYGRRIAHRLRFSHRHEDLGSDYISKFGPEIVNRLGGSAGCYTGWVLAQNQILLDFGRPVLMTGFLGDCISGGHLPEEFAEGHNDTDVLNHLIQRSYQNVFSRVELKRLLRPEVQALMLDSARETIAQSFQQIPVTSPLHRCDYVDLTQRQRRFICTHIALHQPVAPVRDPFADTSVVDLFLRLPLALRLRQELYISMIRRYLPDLARLPRTSDGLPLTASRTRRGLHGFETRLRKRIWQTRRALGLPGGNNPSSRGCFDYGDALRTGSREYITRLLADSKVLPSLINPADIQSLLTTHLSGTKNSYRQVSALATLAEAFRQFVE